MPYQNLMLEKHLHFYISQLNPTQFSKINAQRKYQTFTGQRIIDILEQYEIISPVKKEQHLKGNTLINPVVILAKGVALEVVLDTRYLNSLFNESKCN